MFYDKNGKEEYYVEKNGNIVIVGAGITGLSTAYHLKVNYEIFEKDLRSGGLCKSEEENAFIFDYTGHLLHLENEYVEKLLRDLLKQNLHFQDRKSWIYSKGVYTPYPFQANTHGLPPHVIKECIMGLIKAKYETLRMTYIQKEYRKKAIPTRPKKVFYPRRKI